MECFEVRNHLNDWIDGSIGAKARTGFEDHLGGCKSCENENQRIRALIDILHKQPRSQMPPDLRSAPLAFRVPIFTRMKNLKLFWRELPAPTRLLTEGVLIAAVVILGVQLGPRVRSIYEKNLDERLEKMIRAEDYETSDVPLARGKADADSAASVSDEHETFQDDAEVGGTHTEMHVGKGEIWRFNMKTDSPSLVRAKIMKTFSEIGIPGTTDGFNGVEAPGGIQFDILIPSTSVPGIKSALEKMAINPSDHDNFNDAFTWYKNRSKKPIPNGTTRVVIWLSQI